MSTFDRDFRALTGNPPFPWQEQLFSRLLDRDFPPVCDIPTGLGKTASIAVWLLALAEHAGAGRAAEFPRRLVYVVNRRTIVDQATLEAKKLREALYKPELSTLAGRLRSVAAHDSDAVLSISTLRGEFADNAEWRIDPARPAIIVGTVDMIGSRLLFAGYGPGFRSRPLHAGFLGQDALVLHDEAHLEPAFQSLLESITHEQRRRPDLRPVHLISLTATSRNVDNTIRLTSSDLNHDVVKQRVNASKRLSFLRVADEKAISTEVIRLAREHAESGAAIVIFLRKVEDVERVSSTLAPQACVLTGTMRGYERDALVDTQLFAHFLPSASRGSGEKTVYLVATSAGEVGIDISADHMICDLTTFDGMAQRLGRVNRFGTGEARVDVVYARGTPKNEPVSQVEALEKTFKLLSTLPQDDQNRYDASPQALSELPLEERLAAFAPAPVLRFTSSALFDSWALTSLRQPNPRVRASQSSVFGRSSIRPPVAYWLHGVSPADPPETRVGWRIELDLLQSQHLELNPPGELLEDYPLKPHELLTDRTYRVEKQLQKLAELRGSAPVWVIDLDGDLVETTLAELTNDERPSVPSLANRTVLLPPSVGGLAERGLLDASADPLPVEKYDVADEWRGPSGQRRKRVLGDDDPPLRMRRIRAIQLGTADEESDEPRVWNWYAEPRSADDDGSRANVRESYQLLGDHLALAELYAARFAEKLGLGEREAAAVRMAARWHDLGKARALWQRSIGNNDRALVLAKPAARMRPSELSHYRHEFGSMLDVSELPEFQALDSDHRDLVLHLIAAHHGRARPDFPPFESFDPVRTELAALEVSAEVPARFARLQARYGRWGLAYLESLVRAADALASQPDVALTPAAALPLEVPS